MYNDRHLSLFFAGSLVSRLSGRQVTTSSLPVLRNLAKGAAWSEAAWPGVTLWHGIQMLRLSKSNWISHTKDGFTFICSLRFEKFINPAWNVWQMTKISYFPRAALSRNISHSLKIILLGSGSNLSWVILHPFVSSPPSPTGCSDSPGLRNFYDKPNYFSKFLSHPAAAAPAIHPQWPATRRRLQKQGS